VDRGDVERIVNAEILLREERGEAWRGSWWRGEQLCCVEREAAMGALKSSTPPYEAAPQTSPTTSPAEGVT